MPADLWRRATPDSTLPDAGPRTWEQVELGDDVLTLIVVYTRAVVEALHHVEVREDDHHVVITLHLGLSHEAYETKRRQDGRLAYVLMGVMESAEIRLETPLGARTVVDGANTWPGRALAPKCCAYEYGDPVEIDDSEETRRMGIAGCRGQVVGVRTDEESDEVFAYEVRIEGRPEVCVLSTEDVGHFRE